MVKPSTMTEEQGIEHMMQKFTPKPRMTKKEKEFRQYIKEQRMNEYISDAEENFLLSNFNVFKMQLNKLHRAMVMHDLTNKNFEFIRNILETVKQHLNVIAIV